MAEVYDLRRVRRREKSPEFEMPESWLIVANMFGFDVNRTFSQYCLRRCRRGTEVHIREKRFTMNLSYFTKTYPANFKEARRWIAAVADRYGWQMTEAPFLPTHNAEER